MMVEIVDFVVMLIKNLVVVGAVGVYWLALFYLVSLFSKAMDKIFK